MTQNPLTRKLNPPLHCLVKSGLKWSLMGSIFSLVVLPNLPVHAATNEETKADPPQKDELRMTGTVLDVNIENRSFTINATQFTLPSGKSGSISPAKKKTITISDQTQIRRAGTTDKMILTDLKGREAVIVTGVDTGTGLSLLAREILIQGATGANVASAAPEIPAPRAPGDEINGFKIVNLLSLDEDSNITTAGASGDVAGNSVVTADKQYLFIYRKGKMEKFDTEEAKSFAVGGISPTGVVVGQSFNEATPGMQAYRMSGDKFIPLKGLTYAMGINSAGTICGIAQDPLDRAVVFEKGELRVTTPGEDERDSQAQAINDLPIVVGSVSYKNGSLRAYVSGPGRFEFLGTLGGMNSWASALSPSGLVVGSADVDDKQSHAFLYDGTKMLDLGTFGDLKSQANAVNNFGQVVGTCSGEKTDSIPFLYDHGKLKDINTLLQAPYKEWRIRNVCGITADGQVAATAFYQGKTHAVLLQPVTPIP